MNKDMEHTGGNSLIAILTGSIMAIINSIFNIDPLFIQNIQGEAIKAIVVGFLGALGALMAKGIYGFGDKKITAWRAKKPKAL